jgi:hypothetical protein
MGAEAGGWYGGRWMGVETAARGSAGCGLVRGREAAGEAAGARIGSRKVGAS